MQQEQSYRYPSQIREVIDGVTFSSCFDSGNLGSVKKDGVNKYLLQIQSDQGINGKTTGYRTWFYFSVGGIGEGTLVTFVMTNMQNQMWLYRDGMQVVFRNESYKEWQRCKQGLTYKLTDGNLEIAFKHQFYGDCDVYFAFCFPWSYQENQDLLQQLEQKHNGNEIYFRNDVLAYSVENRVVNLVTISSMRNLTTRVEAPIEKAFPQNSRPQIFENKRYILVSARVHPGEVPSSFVMNGLIKFLMNENNRCAEIARDNFVWVIVPIINPDGVYRGHYRTDSMCQNLNRYYLAPSAQDHPQIYAIKEYLMRLHSTNRLYAYIDLHAHAARKGIFIYGNSLPTLPAHTQNCLFPRLLSMYSENFDYDGCNFTEKNMTAADRGDGLSKEGAGRVALYKATNIVHSYTLECNYNTGKYVNVISKETYDPEITYGSSQLDEDKILNVPPPQTINRSYFYTIPDYEEVGKGIVLAFLDLNLLNPYSRLPDSYFKTLSNLQTFLAINIIKQMPYRFDNYVKKISKNIANKEHITRTLKALYDYLITNTVKDTLEIDKPQTITKYQKAQEIKKQKQLQQQAQQSQQKQKQQSVPKKSICADDFQVKRPVSEFNLDKQNARSKSKIRARSEEKTSIVSKRSIQQQSRTFKNKKQQQKSN